MELSGIWGAQGSSMLQALRKKIKKYLRNEQAYKLHKLVRHRFTKNHTYVAGIDSQWKADLADMQGIARKNGWMRYLLIVID